MKINKINLYNPNYNFTIKNKQNNKQQNVTNSIEGINYAYPPIFFKGKSISKLYEEYNWYINHDRVPALQAFLKIEETPEVMDKFLTEILNTKDRSIQFFDSFLYSPREAVRVTEKLGEKVGTNSKNLMPFAFDSPYNKSYNNYIENKFKNANCLISLLKLRPDWKGDKLIEKAMQLGNTKVEIGNIPKELPKQDLDEITNYLRGQMEVGYKTKKKIPELNIGNRKYEFAYFTEGKSDKNVFGVFTPEGKKYVIKMGKPEARSLDAPFALGTLAKIDFYLTTHRCRNSAPLCYYNHDGNYSIYKYIEHTPVGESSKDLRTISKHLTDFKKLGLSYNDTVGDKNFFKLDNHSTDGINTMEGFEEGMKNNEWISVDNDHVTYYNRLQPINWEYNAELPNAMQMFF